MLLVVLFGEELLHPPTKLLLILFGKVGVFADDEATTAEPLPWMT